MVAVPAGIDRAVRARWSRPVMLAAWLAVATVGCARSGPIPVADRSPPLGQVPARYVVRAGDTLYSIAWRFSLDHRALARANGIEAPYTIYAGQELTLAVEGRRPRPAPRPPSAGRDPATWRVPTDAPVARRFGRDNSGIDYRLGAGHVITAAAAGEVVYAGNGLGGFRHLIIVKHGPDYLSAYGIDRPMAVREGQRVKVGGLLADKGSGGRRSGTLHFEIRRRGEPVDPGSLIGR